MSEFKMPSLGADMESGTLVEWKMKPGDSVKRGDIIAVVETAKGVVEVEVFDTGILDEIYFQPGQEVPVGQVLATICTPEELAQKKAATASRRKQSQYRKPQRLLQLEPPKPAPAAVAEAPPPDGVKTDKNIPAGEQDRPRAGRPPGQHQGHRSRRSHPAGGCRAGSPGYEGCPGSYQYHGSSSSSTGRLCPSCAARSNTGASACGCRSGSCTGSQETGRFPDRHAPGDCSRHGPLQP